MSCRPRCAPHQTDPGLERAHERAAEATSRDLTGHDDPEVDPGRDGVEAGTGEAAEDRSAPMANPGPRRITRHLRSAGSRSARPLGGTLDGAARGHRRLHAGGAPRRAGSPHNLEQRGCPLGCHGATHAHEQRPLRAPAARPQRGLAERGLGDHPSFARHTVRLGQAGIEVGDPMTTSMPGGPRRRRTGRRWPAARPGAPAAPAPGTSRTCRPVVASSTSAKWASAASSRATPARRSLWGP